MQVKSLLVLGVLRLHRCLSRRTHCPSSVERILVVSTTGLGDTLWATPALRGLRGSFPNAYIALLTSPIGRALLSYSPHINELFTFTGCPSLPDLYRILRQRNFDTALIFHTSQRCILPLCQLLKIPSIIGTAGNNKGLDDLLTTRLLPRQQHEIARRIEIATHIGAKDFHSHMELVLGVEDYTQMADFLALYNVPSHLPMVGLHPGAKDRFKQWHPQGFIEVGTRLVQERQCIIVVMGNREEHTLVHTIASNIPGAIPMAGELSIRATAALIQDMQLMISNDTGPMHIACAVGTPTIALFGPTDPARCGPYSLYPVEVIATTATCTPCIKKACRLPFCLLQISAQDVYRQAVQLLEQKDTAMHSPHFSQARERR